MRKLASGAVTVLLSILLVAWVTPASAEDIYEGAKEHRKGVGLDFDQCRGKIFWDPINSGSCWSCPEAAPHRTVFRVDGPTACVGTKPKTARTCGALNQRPCNILERIPSCNANLAEDFIKHKCVSPSAQVAEQMCRLIVAEVGIAAKGVAKGAVSNPTLTAFGGPMRPMFKERQTAAASKVTVNFMKQEVKKLDPQFWKDTVKAINTLKSAENEIFALFSPDVLCSPDKLEKELAKGVWHVARTYAKGGKLYLAIGLTLKAQPVVGLLPTIYVVSEQKLGPTGEMFLVGKPAVYFSLGLSAQSAVSAAAVVGIQNSIKSGLEEFRGWAYDASGGIGSEEVGTILEVGAGLDMGLNAQSLLPDAFGGSVELGAGVGLPFAMTAAYSWRLY